MLTPIICGQSGQRTTAVEALVSELEVIHMSTLYLLKEQFTTVGITSGPQNKVMTNGHSIS